MECPSYQLVNLRKMEQTPKNTHKQLFLTLLKGSISVALLLLVFRKTDLSETWIALQSANLIFFVIAFLVYLISYYIRAYRWDVLLKARGIHTSKLYLFQSYIVGIFFSNFLPSTIGGDAVRVYDIWRIKPDKTYAVTVVFLDRLLGLVVLIFCSFGALLAAQILDARLLSLHVWGTFDKLFGNLVSSPVLPFVFLIVLVGFGLICLTQLRSIIAFIQNAKMPPLLQTLKSKLARAMKSLLIFRKKKGVLAQGLIWSLFVQISVIFHYYLIAVALNLPISFLTFFLIVPLATIVTMLPVSINGIGLRENAFIFFLVFSAAESLGQRHLLLLGLLMAL